MAINQQDFITPITGNIAIQNDGATLVLVSNADANFGFEGDESFKLILRKGSDTGPIVATTVVLVVRDTSNTITYDNLVESVDTFTVGETVTFVLNTTNLGSNILLYYNTSGNVISTDFVEGNTGSVVVVNDTANITFAANVSYLAEGETRVFTLQLIDAAIDGNVLFSSNTITLTGPPPPDYIATPTATPAAFGDALEGGFYAGLIWNQVTQSATSTTIGTGEKIFTVTDDMTATPLFYGGQEIEVRSRAYPTIEKFSVAAQENTPEGVFFKPDGTKMYVMGSTGDAVYEYDLSVAWDVSSATFLQTFSVAGQDIVPSGVFFKPDGTKMYVMGKGGFTIYEYDLSVAWDVSSAVYLRAKSITSQETAPTGLFFKPDGTKMYVTGTAGDDVNEYNLSVAWNVSSASFLQTFSVAAQESNPEGVFFKPDGTKMYVIGSSGRDVNEYDLSVAWDVSSAVFLQTFSVAGQDTSPTGLFFKPDGTKMYVIGKTGDNVWSYTLSSAWDISSTDIPVRMIGTVTRAQGTTLTVNVTSVDGSGTLTDWSVMAKYRVIVAPKSSGENTSRQLKTNTSTPAPAACWTLTEGLKSTLAMVADGSSSVYQAAHFCNDLTIGGYSDWYLPARDEIELMWRNLKPITDNNAVSSSRPSIPTLNYTNLGSIGTGSSYGLNYNSYPQGAAYTTTDPGRTSAVAFQIGGAEVIGGGNDRYWASTVYSTTTGWYHGIGYSYPGWQSTVSYSTSLRVRAVRRSII